jgi:hypothetical protein
MELKNIAVLFAGRSHLFPQVASRIKAAFDGINHNLYYFGHTWNDDFTELNREDSLLDFRKKLSTVNIAPHCFRFDRFSTSSYSEMLDLIEKIDYKLPRLKTTLLAFVSQFYSLRHAANLAFDFSAKHNINYDVIIRWRYDLVIDQFDTNNFNNIVDNTLHVENFNSKIAINDQNFYGSYNTMKNIVSSPDLFLEYFLEAIYNVYLYQITPEERSKLIYEDKKMFCEKMLKDMCKALNPDIQFDSNPLYLPHCCLFREGCDPDWSIQKLHHFQNNNWEGIGWDEKILVPYTPLGPVTSKIYL